MILSFALSLAVNLIFILPTWSFSGVPVNVLVEEEKFSQEGNAFPFSRVASYEKESPASTSWKTFSSNVKFSALSSFTEISEIGFSRPGASFVLLIVRMNTSKVLAVQEGSSLLLTLSLKKKSREDLTLSF